MKQTGQDWRRTDRSHPPPGRRATAADLAIVLLLVAATVGIAAAAPSQTYAYSQLRWIGHMIAIARGGNWLLTWNHFGEPPHKPPLYLWINGPLLRATGLYTDFLFRVPTILAAAATAVMVYLLGRRWYGRRCGLLAAALWVTGVHMSKMMYICTTDMLLTVWTTASVLCVDRLLFHAAPRKRQGRWAIGLWVTMTLGALTKGWGIANLPLVAAFVALAAGLGPGFGPLRGATGFRKVGLAVRLLGHRWWRACGRLRLWWGLPAMAVVVAGTLAGISAAGKGQPQVLKDQYEREMIQRITGEGEDAPGGSGAPPAVHLLYRTLPASVFALGALVLIPIGQWFRRGSGVGVPLCWVVGVTGVYSIPHGFRPDYLLPCYAGVALLGAWGVERVRRRGAGGARPVQVVRHVYAAAAVGAAGAVAVGAGLALASPWLSDELRDKLMIPQSLSSGVVAGLVASAGLGLVGVWAAVRLSLRWRIGGVAAVAVVAMLGVAFVRLNVFSRHACTQDGEKMIAFARAVAKEIGDDKFAVYRAEKIATEVYLGRFGWRLAPPPRDEGIEADLAGMLNGSKVSWLITCDAGLVEIGATHEFATPTGPVDRPAPGDLGQVRVSGEPIFSQGWGRLYLIRLKRPVSPRGTPHVWQYRSGKRGRFN